MNFIFDKLKAFLRKNRFYVSYCQRHVNNYRYFVRNVRFYVSHFKMEKLKRPSEKCMYFWIDPTMKHPGLTDRFKAAVNVYYIAKVNNLKFKLIFDSPFNLSDYLIPAQKELDWRADVSCLSFVYPSSKMFSYNGQNDIPKLSNNINQYICRNYIGYDMLLINKVENYEKVWGECFRELFKPSDRLNLELLKTGLIERSYVSVHFRFVNALEKFEEGYYNELSIGEQEALIDRCLNALDVVKKREQSPVVVFSDSNRFRNIARQNGYIILDGKVGHVSFVHDDNVVMKTFVDYITLGRSKKVYRACAKELYGTVFSFYAALSGGAELEDINI